MGFLQESGGRRRKFNTFISSSLDTAHNPAMPSIQELTQMTDEKFLRLSAQDRVHALFPDYADLMVAQGRDIKRVDSNFLMRFNYIHEEQDKTGYFGKTWTDLVDPSGEFGRYGGLAIGERTLFEAKPWPVAVSFMSQVRKTAEEWYQRAGSRPDSLSIYDVGTGSGTTALAAAVKNSDLLPTSVITIDHDQRIMNWFTSNLRALGNQGYDLGRIHYYHGNAIDHARESERVDVARLASFPASAAFIDMPWRSALYSSNLYVGDLRDMYLLSQEGEMKMRKNHIGEILFARKQQTNYGYENVSELVNEDSLLNGEVVVMLYLMKVAPVVSLHIPLNVEHSRIEESAERIGAHAEVYIHTGYDGGRELTEKQVMFTHPLDKDKIGAAKEQIITF